MGKFKCLWTRGVWPDNLTNLTPIEYIWVILQDSVLKKSHPLHRKSIIKKVQTTWKFDPKIIFKKFGRIFPEEN